ncbi:hypothetical protein PHLCEN_2v4709 [Hermanssonia centrifuga]|uniref:Virilizer N-terminal domain-containing protein n=1 Tax=Hermanssonia centrifuga TaxID=98765 RepID=A0A2R6PNU8_9APHY|nr:hypothetical protein PHLCEN_2v4709 [Hermanssonia centrifuga]
MLLQWCTLEPAGPSNLAAVRFNSAVRVQKITIFPTDDQPFSHSPETVSRTEPEAFFAEVYFNAQILPSARSKERPKPVNALVPTVIAYAGGRMDFAVNMSPEFATRLMIVKGPFQCISMAVYGDIVSEMPPPISTYSPRNIPSFDPILLSSALDPLNFRDPTKLATQLLDLIPEAPPLRLVIRLMFCLKPTNEDWDLPDFPHIYSNLETGGDSLNVESAFNLTSRPVSDETPDASFARFAERVARSVGPKDENQSYYVAGLLFRSACQHPEMARSLLECIDLTKVFDASNMDESTLLDLLDATSNADIARHLSAKWFIDTVKSIENDASSDRETRTVARQLLARLEGMSVFEDALTNTQGDFSRAAATLKEIGEREQSFGIWLESMVTHQDLMDKLGENPTMTVPLQHPPLLFSNTETSVSHEEFVAFLRALIGVSCVLAVCAWADSLPDQYCHEFILGILRLWQGIDGYREILNHLLLLRQMIVRLEYMLDNDLPTKAGIDTEHILTNLAKEPRAFLRPEFIKCILALKPPHCYITNDARLSMRKAALIADDGLLGAADQLLSTMERPPTFENIRALRVALAVLDREINERGDFEVLQEFWKEGSCSLETCLVDLFTILTEQIGDHFSVVPPPRTPLELVSQLFRASSEIIQLLLRLASSYPLTGRVTRVVIRSTADLFVCTDAVDMLYAQTSATCEAAQETRQSCIEIVRSLANLKGSLPGGKLYAEIVLRTLLDHGLHSTNRDPSHHLLQVFCLIDYLLPMPELDGASSDWVQKVVPNTLRELLSFCRALDTENKAHFVRRLVRLDEGIIGVGDWLLQEELKELVEALKALEDPNPPSSYRLVRLYQVSLCLRFLLDLVSSSSSVSTWCVNCIACSTDVARLFATCLQIFIEQDLVSPQYTRILRTLATDSTTVEDTLKLPLALALLRTCQYTGSSSPELTSSLYLAQSLMLTISHDQQTRESISYEISAVVLRLSRTGGVLEGALSDAVVGLLEWLVDPDAPSIVPLHGFSSSSFATFCDSAYASFNAEKKALLEAIRSNLIFVDEPLPIHSPVPLPDRLDITIHDIEDLLHPAAPSPSTPPRKALAQDVLSLVAISPPTALIRSPASTGLTKTYSNNDFRQLRQTPSARQNTSRLPSMHVDVGSII